MPPSCSSSETQEKSHLLKYKAAMRRGTTLAEFNRPMSDWSCQAVAFAFINTNWITYFSNKEPACGIFEGVVMFRKGDLLVFASSRRGSGAGSGPFFDWKVVCSQSIINDEKYLQCLPDWNRSCSWMTYLLSKSLDSFMWRIKASRQVHWRHAQQGAGVPR